MAKKLVHNFFMELDIPIFHRRIVAFFGTHDEFRKRSRGLFSSETEWLHETNVNCGGLCLSMTGNGGHFELIYICSDFHPQSTEMIVWHEALHATINTLSDLGININRQEQETATYLQGYIALNLHNYIKSRQKKRKGASAEDSESHSESTNVVECDIHANKREGRSYERYANSFTKGRS